MVMKGQFLERPTLIPVGKRVLEGLWHRGAQRPGVLIVPPRPDEGGGMDHVIAAELAWAVASAGHPTLRFNFRGVGASQGERGDDATLLADATAALRVLEENLGEGDAVVVSIGDSAPVAVALSQREAGVTGLCFVAPGALPTAALASLRVPFRIVVAQHDDGNDRAALAEVAAQTGGSLEVIEGADRTFNKNLPHVGRAVASWMRFRARPSV